MNIDKLEVVKNFARTTKDYILCSQNFGSFARHGSYNF